MLEFESVYQPESIVDLSTQGRECSVTIKGSMGSPIPMAYDWVCYVRSVTPRPSGWTKELIIDPGPTEIDVACEHFSGVHDRATFDFDAIAGHAYQARTSPFTCPSLYDRSEKAEIARQDCPPWWRGPEAHKSGD